MHKAVNSLRELKVGLGTVERELASADLELPRLPVDGLAGSRYGRFDLCRHTS
jgi:hypothetical protein